jgi:hypothetical protein
VECAREAARRILGGRDATADGANAASGDPQFRRAASLTILSCHPIVTRDRHTSRRRAADGFHPMMKTLLLAFALTILGTSAFAYTCEDVRRFVAENGLAQARAKARAAGMTDDQERQAAACLGIRIGPNGRAYRAGRVYRTGHPYRTGHVHVYGPKHH